MNLLQNISNILPKFLKYSIRVPIIPDHSYLQESWETDKLFPVNSMTNLPRNDYQNETNSPYEKLCFLSIQNAIERQFLRLTSDSLINMPIVQLRHFPYPAVSENGNLDILQFVPFFIMISFIFSCKNTIKVR